jgi:hypothetical protein
MMTNNYLDNDDERAPYIAPGFYNHHIDEPSITLTQALRDYIREEQDKLYGEKEDIWWKTTTYYCDLFDDIQNEYENYRVNELEQIEDQFNEEDVHYGNNKDLNTQISNVNIAETPVNGESVFEDESDFDPIKNDPLLCSVARKFAYV